MKTFLIFIISIVICPSIFVSTAQAPLFGIGDGQGFFEPEPAQGNSAGIDFQQGFKNIVSDLSKDYCLSFDSDESKVILTKNIFQNQNSSFRSTGTEIIDLEGIEIQNQEQLFIPAIFYYSMILESRTSGWAWYLNYDWASFQERLTTLGNTGYRIENIDTYGRYVYNYGGTWTQDGQGWAWVLNYTDLNSFANVLTNWPLGTPRYRPIDFVLHPSGAQSTFGAVAVADNVGFAWIFNESSSNNFITWINSQYGLSRRIVEIELYLDPSGNVRYGGISENAGYAQQIAFGLTLSQFQTTNTQWINQGYRLVDFDKYAFQGNTYYAGLWNNDGVGYAFSLDYNNLTNFQTMVNTHISNGFKPIVVDVYDDDWVVSLKNQDGPDIKNFMLAQNYPNPFNPSTTITFDMPRSAEVFLNIYNSLGEEITTLVSDRLSAGSYSYEWNASHLPSGVYFYKIQADDYIETKKMILIR
jgi:hypothetical protein